MPANIRLRIKLLAVKNTLAFCNTESITTVKSFTRQAPSANVIKLFMPVIYEARVLVPGWYFKPSVMFVGMASSLPWSGASFGGPARVGSGPNHINKIILERLVRDKHSSLL